jgi:prevent-host-death family protein
MPRTIGAGEFKAKCLKLLDEVNESGETLVITKHGKPVAELHPAASRVRKSPLGALKGTVTYMGDVISPVEVEWEALSE